MPKGDRIHDSGGLLYGTFRFHEKLLFVRGTAFSGDGHIAQVLQALRQESQASRSIRRCRSTSETMMSGAMPSSLARTTTARTTRSVTTQSTRTSRHGASVQFSTSGILVKGIEAATGLTEVLGVDVSPTLVELQSV